MLEVQFRASDGRDYPLLAFPLDPRTLLVFCPYNGEDEPDGELTADDVGAANRVTWGQAQHVASLRLGGSGQGSTARMLRVMAATEPP